jgi:hypothetical protein
MCMSTSAAGRAGAEEDWVAHSRRGRESHKTSTGGGGEGQAD